MLEVTPLPLAGSQDVPLNRVTATGSSGKKLHVSMLWFARGLILSILAHGLNAQVVDAHWSQPFLLSSQEAKPERAYGITADSKGNFHVVWAERALPDERVVLQYSRFDGYSWSGPVQIYVSRPGFRIGSPRLTIDRDDNLYLTWTESDLPPTLGPWPGIAPVMYTRVRAEDALTVGDWPTPKMIKATALFSRLRVDSTGRLHLVYTDTYSSQPGIFYIRSVDDGDNWSDPVRLDKDIPTDNYPFFSGLELDQFGGLHVVWEYKSGWQTTAIQYTRSVDGGITWFDPTTLDKISTNPNEIEFGYPLLAVQGWTIHVVWAGGGSANIGRRHRYSTDGGQSWSPISQLFGNLEGFVGGEALIPGPDGRLHFLDQLRFPAGLYYAYWEAGKWSEPSLVYLIQESPEVPIGDRIHIHQLNLAVSRDQLLVTFTPNPDEGPISLFAMHTYKPISRSSYIREIGWWPRGKHDR